MREDYDIAVIGAGAAGLMAGIWAGRAARASGRPSSILVLDGAKTLGAKILVAGGGRCNVTHHAVDESAYAGSSRHAIKKVLRRFDVARTVEFFRDLGVELKREETGKLFPTTDRARTVLDALLAGAHDAGVEIVHPWRVDSVRTGDLGFEVVRCMEPPSDARSALAPEPTPSIVRARSVILATGGLSLPKTGSDGHGHAIARSLGHSITPHVLPALVPLTLHAGHALCALSGISVPATLELRSASGKKLQSFTNSILCTHFGLSGPGVLDMSRHYLAARTEHDDDRGAGERRPSLHINWLPGETPETLDAEFRALGRSTPVRLLRQRLPERLADTLVALAGIPATTTGDQLTRDQRRALVTSVTELTLPIIGDRGFAHAEVTAGGVPLSEIRLETMESRARPGLFLCGEICDVDGRIGGFNFQWAWASGFVAGTGAAGTKATE